MSIQDTCQAGQRGEGRDNWGQKVMSDASIFPASNRVRAKIFEQRGAWSTGGSVTGEAGTQEPGGWEARAWDQAVGTLRTTAKQRARWARRAL